MKFKVMDEKPLHRGFFRLDAYTIEHECFDGSKQVIVREHLERGDAVAVLLYDPEADEVLLLRQFRIGPAVRQEDPWLVEIVAGMIDPDESSEAAAKRECEEETGYRPETLEHLCRYYSTPGGSSERIDLYLGLTSKHAPNQGGGGMAHEHEDIECFWVPRRQALDWISTGKIDSAAPILALLLAFGCPGRIRTG